MKSTSTILFLLWALGALLMTAPCRAALVDVAAGATNHNATSAGVIIVATISPADHFDRFAALSMIESGDRDDKIGPNGELSRYQIMPAVWTNAAPLIPTKFARMPQFSCGVAIVVQMPRFKRFQEIYHRDPDAFEWYLLWHRPAVAYGHRKPTAAERDRAMRFANLCSGGLK